MSTFFKSSQVTVQAFFSKAQFKSSIKPRLTLSGDWIQKAGFEIGDTLKVETKNGKITISKKNENTPLKKRGIFVFFSP